MTNSDNAELFKTAGKLTHVTYCIAFDQSLCVISHKINNSFQGICKERNATTESLESL